MKFIKNIFLLFVLVVALDQLSGIVLHYLYFNLKSGAEFETTYAFTKTDADIIVTGSSKARRNYNTPLISDSLGMTCYNAGHDGQSVLFSYAMTKMILAHHTPKMIVVEIFPEEMYYTDLHYDRLNILLPYYSDYPEIREVCDWRGARKEDSTSIEKRLFAFNTEKIKLLSQCYRYNSMWLDIATGYLKKEKIKSGYLPLTDTITEAEKNNYISEFENRVSREKDRHIDPNKIKSLLGIIELCKKKNVIVVVSMSPVLKRYNDDPVYKSIIDITAQNNVPFLDFTGDERFNHLEYFADNHLNKSGSSFYSQVLADSLKKIISSSIRN
ncbi:MAG TPA: hypothetical protein DCQ93_00440 [Bacteroidetes bacterium]|nr:hypothetical protein [Bacteroidota bacterium]